jgi:rare lipoprotein A (peptidoglycan hydrolase)
VRRAVRTASLALCAAALLSLPAPASAAELDELTARLDAAAAETERLAAELEQAAGRDGGLRLQLDRLAGEVEDARARVRARARQAYLATAQPAPLPRLVTALAAPDLRAHADAELADAQARLTRARRTLDTASASVTVALTPAQTARSRRAAEREAPVVALVEAAGSGYPSGWTPGGTVLRGVASWYGPGFVGKPTASGAPYDPERLTCAHKTLPLGTVVRVSREGRAISCLVNDRGPYVGRRIIDLSRAGSRALGFDGVAPVVVEVLVPGA